MSTPPAPRASSDRQGWFAKVGLRAGALAILPLSIAVFPFGLAYGVAVAASTMNDLAGIVAPFVLIAGAAQLAVVDLIDQGAPWFVIVGTALVINARLVMYAGALAPTFSEFPRRWRIPLAHLMTDQATVTTLLHTAKEHDPRMRMAFYVGAGGSFALVWFAGTIAGVLVGFAVTLLSRDAPLNTGLLIGAAAGVAFGMLARLGTNAAGGVASPHERTR